jgi:hypothetical protein
MNSNRPDISDEDIGMRAFQLRKEKAVERAVERLRAGIKDSWAMFSQRDLADLNWIFGEVWAYLSRAEWDDLHFSKLSEDDVVAVLELTRELRKEQINTVDTFEKVAAIVRKKS